MAEEIWWRRPLVVAACVCVGLGLAVLLLGPRLRASPVDPGLLAGAAEADEPFAVDEPRSAPAAAVSPVPTEVIVYISGAVAAPDVYRLPAGARVKDAVLAAGGLLPEAAAAVVNLAAPLSDAEHIHIPAASEAAAPVPAASEAAATAGLIDLNSASAAELEELPGVGKTLSARILAYRDEHGPFRSVDDLSAVSGIGAKLFAQIAPLVTTGGG